MADSENTQQNLLVINSAILFPPAKFFKPELSSRKQFNNGKKSSVLIIVLAKSVLRLTRSQNFLGLIFLMSVSLGNKKKFGKQAKLSPIYPNFSHSPRYLQWKNKVLKKKKKRKKKSWLQVNFTEILTWTMALRNKLLTTSFEQQNNLHGMLLI